MLQTLIGKYKYNVSALSAFLSLHFQIVRFLSLHFQRHSGKTTIRSKNFLQNGGQFHRPSEATQKSLKNQDRAPKMPRKAKFTIFLHFLRFYPPKSQNSYIYPSKISDDLF